MTQRVTNPIPTEEAPEMLPRSAQSFLVDRIKRRAFARLHDTPEGEAALLEMYLVGEDLPETHALFTELARIAPDWLKATLAEQAKDEQRHAELLRARLAEVGARPDQVGNAMGVAGIKMRRLAKLVDRFASDFRAGRVVPLVAIVLSLERTGVRVMARHRDVLLRRGPGRGEHPVARLLESVLADEKRHVRDAEHALDRLVRPAEKLALMRLLDEADAVDRSLGITGAVGMLAMGWTFRGLRAVKGLAEVIETRASPWTPPYARKLRSGRARGAQEEAL